MPAVARRRCRSCLGAPRAGSARRGRRAYGRVAACRGPLRCPVTILARTSFARRPPRRGGPPGSRQKGAKSQNGALIRSQSAWFPAPTSQVTGEIGRAARRRVRTHGVLPSDRRCRLFPSPLPPCAPWFVLRSFALSAAGLGQRSPNPAQKARPPERPGGGSDRGWGLSARRNQPAGAASGAAL